MVKRYITIDDITIGKGSKYVFSELIDFDAGATHHQESSYAGADGGEYSEIYFDPKEFSVEGTIIAGSYEEMHWLKRQLINRTNPKKYVDVHYNNGIDTYYCRCLPNGAAEFGTQIVKETACILPFNINLKNPDFYWLSEEIQTDVHTSLPLLTAESVLPCIFSTRINKQNITIYGDDDVYPVIRLVCNSDSAADSVTISNNTSGKAFVLNYKMSENECITIDNYNGTIISDSAGDLINQVDRIDNFFSLRQGDNELQIITGGIVGRVIYREKYIGV